MKSWTSKALHKTVVHCKLNECRSHYSWNSEISPPTNFATPSPSQLNNRPQLLLKVGVDGRASDGNNSIEVVVVAADRLLGTKVIKCQCASQAWHKIDPHQLLPAIPTAEMGEQVSPTRTSAATWRPREPSSPATTGVSAFWTESQHCWGPVWHWLLLKMTINIKDINLSKTYTHSPGVGVATARTAKAVVATMASLENILRVVLFRRVGGVVVVGSNELRNIGHFDEALYFGGLARSFFAQWYIVSCSFLRNSSVDSAR